MLDETYRIRMAARTDGSEAAEENIVLGIERLAANIVGSANAAEAPRRPSAHAQKVPPQLLGSKAIEAITGSTINFYAPNSLHVVIFIAADHTADMLKTKPQQNGQRSTLEWSSNNAGQLCFDHETPCTTVKVYGVQGLIGNKEVVPLNIEPLIRSMLMPQRINGAGLGGRVLPVVTRTPSTPTGGR